MGVRGMIWPMPAPLSRRVFVGLLGLSGASALAGCSLDPGTDPAPTGPDATDPVIQGVPDLPTLIRAHDRARELARLADGLTGGTKTERRVLARARTDLGGQADVLGRLLAAGGLPDTATATASPGDDAVTTTAPASDTSAGLRRLSREAATDVGPTSLDALAGTSAANLTMLVSMAGQRGALASALGTLVAWPALAGPRDAAAATLLTAWRPVVYGFQVLGAKAAGDERAAFTAALSRLEALASQLSTLAGAEAGPPPLGYTLDGDLQTSRGRKALAVALLATLPPAVLTGTDAYTDDAASVAGSVRLLAETLDLARPWALDEGPFPGMELA